MESGAENIPEQTENQNTTASDELIRPAAINSAPANGENMTDSSMKGAAAQHVEDTPDKDSLSASSSVKPLPLIKTLQPMDTDSVRNAIFGDLVVDGAAVGEDTTTASKKKKKKKNKRPKSAQASSSCESTQSSPDKAAAADEVEVVLTDSMEAMVLAEGSHPVPSESKEKKKKKKKKKDKTEADSPDGGKVDVPMDVDETVSAADGSKKEQQGQKQLAGSSDLHHLAQNLLNKQKMSRQQQQMVNRPVVPHPLMQQQVIPPQHMMMQYPGMQQHPMMQQHLMQHQQGQIRHQGQGYQGQCQNRHNQKQQQGQKRNQNTPQGGHKHKNQQKKVIYEPYWKMEDVSRGLKQGTLIQGPIRINPKNYEDAYVPLPDGTADIYISGMADRNRALNGDIVAVLVQDKENWRVFTEEVEEYEKCNTPKKTEKKAEEKKAEEEDQTSEKANNSTDLSVSTDVPDVLVEEEEEVELDSSGKPIEGTQVTKLVTGDAATPAQKPIPSQPSTTPATSSPGCKGARSKDSRKCDGSSNNPQGSGSKSKRYKSVKEMLENSATVRKLFDAKGTGGEEDEEEMDTDKFMQRTGKVVAIVEKKHSRVGSGNLRPLQDPNHNFTTFSPNDNRVPRIMIPSNELPIGFKERPEDFSKTLFIARITEWNETSKMPKGSLARSLGEAGQVEPETESLLIENDIDTSDFSDKVLACLPHESPWTIPAKELEWRRDLRKECIFTIDPATARDLDDALHCTDLGDGTYEVGVHIADVSYFVEEGTELDEVAQARCTSVYLVQKVIPMLPRLLCEELCSLNPDADRLSFSVIWKITENGEILEEWFGRTVIRSCVKLSYDHAQGFIDQPEKLWTAQELPPVSGNFTVNDIKTRVLQMNKIAKSLRKARFDSGALRLDQVKIQFTLNKESGLPNGYFVFEARDSNKLVEEFMLLANMAVAHRIRTCHKNQAVLRCHPPPQTRMIKNLKELCDSLGININVSSARDIQLSLARYTGEDYLSQARLQVLVNLCSRPMRNARYFCCGMLTDEGLYHHYALNVPLYTHFTSPIRRYPDILVHRTLAASLGYCKVTDRNPAELEQMAKRCNDMKTNAKACSERSNEVYFSIFVKEAGPLEEKGMVMMVLDKSFDVFILRLGVVKRVYCERLPLESLSYRKEGKRPELTLVWKPDDNCPHSVTQQISIFTCVNCLLKSEPEPLKWSAFVHRPVDGDTSIVR